MASIINTLPIELITTIMETIGAPVLQGRRDNSHYDPALEDLKACSVACRHFLPLCQRYIFNAIYLETHDRSNGQSPIRRFSEIVEISPNIGSYVQRLNLWITPNSPEKFDVGYHSDTVASALRTLTKLKTLVLRPWDVIDWNHIPSSLTSEIYHLFQLPTLTIIEVQRTHNFSIHTLSPCSGLQTLTLQDSSLDDTFSQIPSAPLPVNPVQPINLHIAGASTEIGVLPKIRSAKLSDRSSLFDFGRLEMFLMAINFIDDVHTTSDFLREVKLPFLKGLNLAFAPEIDKHGIVAMSLNSAMKVIKSLLIWFICPASGINEHLLGMCTFLKNLSNTNQIQTLKITMEYLPSIAYFSDDPNWEVVNDILLGPGWSSLTEVGLEITSFTDHESLPQARTRAAILKKLPQTRLKGLSSNKSFEFVWTFKSIVQDPRGFQYTADL